MKIKIAVIGLGYVGLPLALEFSKKYDVVGYDIDINRINELINGIDQTKEVEISDLESSKMIFTSNTEKIKDCNFYIVTVPTPIDEYNKPDLNPLNKASIMIGKFLKYEDIVIYESTVYPGCTEENCVPILEKESGLIFNKDFYCGYSPERINPGDKKNTLTKIKKVTSGSTIEIGKIVDDLYASIITAGTHLAPSLKVAEASKAIENAQRDVNISFVNELALIFDKIGIDTNEVLEAAGTKWNFLNYKPGLVGGHCISVDPYYLAHKAESLGYYPEVILSGRRVNSRIDRFVANKVIKLMIQKGIRIKGANALVIGITFKENCPDIRNTKIIGIYDELKEFGLNIDVYDPIACKKEVKRNFNIELIDSPNISDYDSIILAVPHNEVISEYENKIIKSNNKVIFDLKAILDKNKSDSRL
ncbi:MAG: Vi polysaccharide biosynthesis protein VipA/TviB [Candidatus Marinimicrobia bacterium]|nr:Vi polysaccharide biosynthesis protein VipA/TviB [Candidatus Neomarinimicrobiota bacterium]|tara:strand:- start:6963 stop:8219 length:1257 start_codon:yes stop_codon:yes gene_type:complete